MLFSYKRATFSYFVEYVGKRFTSSDNSRFMPAYSLHNATIGYGFKLFSVLAEMQFQLNNILDSSYQSIAWQPMPGRNFRLNLKLTMVKK
jgi:iron complex outermembrane receptor protein